MAEATVAVAPAPRLNLNGLWIAPPLLVLAVLFFYPLGLIVRASLGEEAPSLQTFEQVLKSSQFLDGLYHTIVIAISATAGCIVLGFVLSLVIAFVPFPERKWPAG
jgi:2-aminoethylphosphonate transport system permease protein